MDSREQLAAAHQKIAQLESHLALLKRGFDPPPLTNPISEERHRAMLFATERSAARRSSWLLLAILIAVVSWAACYAAIFWQDSAGIHPTVGPISSYAKLHGPPVSPVTAGPPRAR